MNFFNAALRVVGNALLKTSPKVIVRVDGGLGSQMWQYALGQSIALSCGLPVLYDISWFDENGMDTLGVNSRKFELTDIFPGVSMNVADADTRRAYRRFFRVKNEYACVYYPPFLSSLKPRFMDGYYNNYCYIKPAYQKLLDHFSFSMQGTLPEAKNPVAVHIRRGDYVESIFDVTGAGYFREAAKQMRARLDDPTFFVFSNDMEWARCALEGEECVFMGSDDNDRGAADMYLMSLCRHFIISNSSFGWWPAWLCSNPDKIVIMPDRWYTDGAKEKYKKDSATAMLFDGAVQLHTSSA